MTAFMTVAALVLVMYTAMVDMAMVSTCTGNYEVIETDYNTAALQFRGVQVSS